MTALLFGACTSVLVVVVSHRHRFIYLKTGKTAGTSVEIYFERFCIDPEQPFDEVHEHEALVSDWGIVGYRGPNPVGQLWFNHMPAASVRDLVGPEVWNGYYKFCVVRNPFDKAVSTFWFQISDLERRRLAGAPFADVRKAFRVWALGSPFVDDRDVFLIDGHPIVNFFVRYEQLADDLEVVCRKVGVAWDPTRLGRYKANYRPRREPFDAYYGDDTAALVSEAYRWEIQHLGYSLTRRPEV